MIKVDREIMELDGTISTIMAETIYLVKSLFLLREEMYGEEQALKDMTEIFKKGLVKNPPLDNEIRQYLKKILEE